MVPWTFIKRKPLAIGSMARINPIEGVSRLLILVVDFAIDSHQCSLAMTVAWIEVSGCTITGVSELGLRIIRNDCEWWETMQ
jgi:hypothetical protein